MSYKKMKFDNIVYAELGREGNIPPLTSMPEPVGIYNDIRDGNRFTWYVYGESVYNSTFNGFFEATYYDSLRINGLAYFQFIPSYYYSDELYLDYSTIAYIPTIGVKNRNLSDEVIEMPLSKMAWVESPRIVGIRLVTNGNVQFNNYTLRVYVIPGTQH